MSRIMASGRTMRAIGSTSLPLYTACTSCPASRRTPESVSTMSRSSSTTMMRTAERAGHVLTVNAPRGHLPCPLTLSGQGNAGPARLRKPDGDRLLGRARAVLAFADVVDLLAHEFTGDGARRLSLARLFARQRAF